LNFFIVLQAKNKLEPREGLRISKTNELTPLCDEWITTTMLLLPLIIHLLNNSSKDDHVVKYEGERGSGTLALGVNVLVVYMRVSFTRT
jgi:hypothetical protein